jgi:hypothetical protein
MQAWMPLRSVLESMRECGDNRGKKALPHTIDQTEILFPDFDRRQQEAFAAI